MVRRYAFSMIELIFAIVIVAITVLSLPMLSEVSTKSSTNNLKASEAVFEAYVKAVESTDENFTALTDIAKTSVIEGSSSLAGLKFSNDFSVEVTNNASFGATLNSADVKKVQVTIYDEQGNEITKLTTYKFNM